MTPGDELVDVIDDGGATVGTVTRRAMREGRLPHCCTYILVFNRRGELFVHLRTATKDVYPSHFDVCVGGVLSAGESFDEGARRELAEELGVAATPEPLFPFRYADDRTVVQAFVYRVTHDGPFTFQPEEVVSGEFLPLEAIAARAGRPGSPPALSKPGYLCPDGLAVLAEYRRREVSPGVRGAGESVSVEGPASP